MAILKIARMGHPVLLADAAPVADPGDPEVQRLIDDMIDTMRDAEGVGLAAPQVHRRLRLILAVDPDAAPEGRMAPPEVLINPELIPLDNEREEAFEGCLSIPEIRGLVPRYRRVALRGLDRHGREVEREAQGFFARVLQHEVDHLNGILYPMRMTDLSQLGYVSELRHAAAAAAAAERKA
ncbi:MAG TPA: peptide deformylase [Geminicoccaceae bacterium]|nr:peptide deformylase [Geminicoccaceae bacterium]